MPTGDDQAAHRSWLSVIPKWLRHGLLIFVVLLVVEFLVVPKLVGASKHLDLLTRLKVGWLIAGVIFEVGSFLCYALLIRRLLPGGKPGLSKLVRIVLAASAISHVIPGGTIGSAGLGYRLLTTNGVEGTDAGFALATAAVGGAVVLNALLWLALIVSIPLAGLHPIYVVVALVGVLGLFVATALIYTFTRGEERSVRVVRALGRRIPRVGADRLEQIVREIGDSVVELGHDRSMLRMVILWSGLNWLLDAASLWSFLAALGRLVDPFELFVAYGIGNVLAVIPVTPGGLGIIEASTGSLLVSFGIPASVATFGVLGWRLVNYWLPIPVGAGAYLSLRVPRGSGLKASRKALSEMASEAKHPIGESDQKDG